MNSCVISNEDWFEIAMTDFESQLLLDDCWPWSNVTKDQWQILAGRYRAGFLLTQLVQPCLLVIAPFGVLGSILSVASIWRRSVIKREHFFVWMLLISLTDLVFNSLYIPLTLHYDGQFARNLYQNSYAGTVVATILPGFMSAFSMASDLCTLALTAERYLGVCKPGFVLKNRWRSCAGLAIILFSAIRFVRSAVEWTAVEVAQTNSTSAPTYTVKLTTVTESSFFTCLVLFCDVASPFVLLVMMIYLSIRFALVVARRNRSRICDTKSIRNRQEKRDQTVSMLRLLSILVVLYIFCQLGYCFYAIVFTILLQWQNSVGFDSGFDDLKSDVNLRLYISLSAFIAYTIECLSRSLNFYLYVLLSDSIRNEFKQLFTRK